MDTKTLWQERLQAFLRVFTGYMRLIANSGFLFAVFFLILFGSYYYSYLIEQIPEAFPIMLFLAVVLSFFIVRSPLRTFLKRADLVFLLAAEERMKAYFTAAVIYNIVLQSFLLLVIAIVLAPLYAVEADTTSYPYFMLIILFVMVKAWNVSVNWFLLRLQFDGGVMSYGFLRAAASFVIVFLALDGASPLYLVLLAVIMVLFWLYLANVTVNNHGVKWEKLIEIDEALVTRFYRLANAFTDVPILKRTVRQRRWLNAFAELIPFKQRYTLLFLYTKAFCRTGDYFGIYARLLVLGAIVVAVLPHGYGRVVGFLLFLYLSAVQLRPLFHHFAGQEMVKLYPVSDADVTRSFQLLFLLLLFIQSAVYTIGLLVSGTSVAVALALFIVGVLLSYGYAASALKNDKKGRLKREGV